MLWVYYGNFIPIVSLRKLKITGKNEKDAKARRFASSYSIYAFTFD